MFNILTEESVAFADLRKGSIKKINRFYLSTLEEYDYTKRS
jgi:hypothetical protein